ncbi:MAG: hypothetical protein ABSG15_11055, partial [FCB group bacterium]
MKTFQIVLLAAIAVLVLLCSCNDIGNFGNNVNRDITGTTLSAKDTLGFLQLSPIDLGTGAKGRYMMKNVTFNNISDTITVIINSVQFKNN